MFHLLITKSSTYAAKTGGGVISGINELNLLADGAIAVFTDRNELVTTANASTIFENRKGFFIAVGGNGTDRIGTDLSPVIERENIVFYTKKDYVAPAKQKIIVGVGDTTGAHNIGTIAAGDIALMRITDTTGAIIPSETIERYEYRVKTGDGADEVLDALIAQINAKSVLGTAAAHGTPTDGFAFTVANFNQTVEITFDGIISEITIDYSVTANGAVRMTYGVGAPANVARLEEEVSPILGNTNKIHLSGYYYKRKSAVDLSATYDMYHLGFQGTRQVGQPVVKNTTKQEVIIAMPDGATQQTAFQTIMAAALAVENAVFNGIES